MQELILPVSAARSDLCSLIERVQTGSVTVIFTRHGQRKAVLAAYRPQGKPWRRKADPKKFGDLQSPVLEDWQ